MKRWHMAVIPLTCLAATMTARSQDSISFSKAREIILSQNAGLKSAQTETDAAHAAIAQAGILPNPSVAVSLDRFGTNEIEASIEQPIELGGRRRSRTEVARRELDVAQNDRDGARLELEAEIVRRFIPIAATSRRLMLLDSVILISEGTKEQIRKRIEEGASRKTDLIRAEIEIERLKAERSELARENEQARRRFAALGGEQDPALLRVYGSFPDATGVPALDDLRNALKSCPALRSSDLERQRLAAQQRQLRADAAPTLSVSAGYLRNNPDNTHSPLLGLGMDIPLFNRNNAAQKQVELQRQAADERRANTLRLLDAEVRDLHSRLLEIDRHITTLKTSAIPKSGQVSMLVQEYYNAGSAGFLDLAAAQSEMLRLRMDLLDLETERAGILTELMQTTSFHIQIVR